jgi:hypothetical protein
MADRYDAIAAREYTASDGTRRTTFTRIGVAFPMREKDGFSIQLDAMPAPVDGQFKIMLMVPKPREQAQQTTAAGQSYGQASGGFEKKAENKWQAGLADLDSEIPF